MEIETQTDTANDIVDELLGRIGQVVGRGAEASAVFAEPVRDGGVTVIPVARTRFGFGGGGGSGTRQGQEGSGGGGGGGAAVTPLGYIEICDGRAAFKRIWSSMDLAVLLAAGSLAALTVKRVFD
jgi:uncharacterized spore protein YtfJ